MPSHVSGVEPKPFDSLMALSTEIPCLQIQVTRSPQW